MIDLSAIFNKRSQNIYASMQKRAKRDHMHVPFSLGEFRAWLHTRFDRDWATRCFYSGQILTVEDFVVDHRDPISRGGSFDFENLAVCSKKENLRKGEMTAEEYRKLVEHVRTLPAQVQDSIWRRLEVGDVQRFGYFRRSPRTEITVRSLK